MHPYLARVGGLHVEAFSRPPTGSGDLWDLIETPYGTRLIIADAIGRGTAAARLAARIRETWREIAVDEPTTSGIAFRLDLALAMDGDPERFVTALLMTLPGTGPAQLVCCGHPPPLLLRGSTAAWAEVLPPAPPLGLLGHAGSWAEPSELPFAPGDRMLLLTDGVTEARDPAGRFYPVAERITALAEPGLLASLAADLERHTAGRPQDDTLMVLVTAGR